MPIKSRPARLYGYIVCLRKLFKSSFSQQVMARVRIKLSSVDIDALNNICNNIKDIASKSGVVIAGPIPLPTRKLKVTTRKSPCGNGTATFDRFEMRIHKRVIDLPSNDKVLHSIMRVSIPRTVNIKIEMKD
jgi:small subunit ribosomal protein S10